MKKMLIESFEHDFIRIRHKIIRPLSIMWWIIRGLQAYFLWMVVFASVMGYVALFQ